VFESLFSTVDHHNISRSAWSPDHPRPVTAQRGLHGLVLDDERLAATIPRHSAEMDECRFGRFESRAASHFPGFGSWDDLLLDFLRVDGRGWARHPSRVVVDKGHLPLVFVDHVGDQVRVEEEKEDGRQWRALRELPPVYCA
jgi:hypothetical protein